jgi:hypothetical protein
MLPVTFESESLGEIRRMSSVPVPGLCGLLRNPSSKRDGKRRILILKREPQVSIDA